MDTVSSQTLVLLLVAVLLAVVLLALSVLRWRSAVRRTDGANQADAPTHTMAVVRTAPDRVVVGDDSTGTVDIRLISDWSSGTPLADLPVPASTAALFQPLLAQAVKLAKANSAANTYVLEFSPEVTKGLKGRLFKPVAAKGGGVRAMTKGADGKFVGQGTLRRVGMAPLVPAMLWQGLAAVTQQKFLADIDEKLGQLQTGLAALKGWLETEQLGRLQGDIQYLLDLRASLASDGSVTDAPYQEQLEGIVRDRYADLAAIGMRMDQLGTRMSDYLAANGWRTPTEQAMAMIADLERLNRAFYLAAGGQALAIQYQRATGSPPDLARRRLQRLEQEIRAHQIETNASASSRAAWRGGKATRFR